VAAVQPFFDQLEPDAARALTSAGTVRTYRRGAALFHERQESDAVYVLRSGTVKIVTGTSAGKDAMLGIRGPGDLLGEVSAIDGRVRSAGAIALEACEAIAVPGSVFRSVLAAHPAAAIRVLEMLCERLRDADAKRSEHVALDTLARVVGRLVELADRFGQQTESGTVIDVALTQEDLAGWAGASREAVAKALQTLRDLGLVRTDRRRVVVVDLPALRGRLA
jgi:CRP-like cAMP-binding protein